RYFEFLMNSMIQNLLNISVVEGEKNSEWRHGLFESGLIEARTVRVVVDSLKGGKEFGIQVKWGLTTEGDPFVKLCHRKYFRCVTRALLYAILRSSRTAGHPKVSLNADEMAFIGRFSPAIKNALRNFWRLMWPTESLVYVEKLAEIQEDLLSE